MKASLYNEQEQQAVALDERQQALADGKPTPVDVPKQGMYIVNYKALAVPTAIAVVILAIWAVATWLL